jgi:hypothetical protein
MSLYPSGHFPDLPDPPEHGWLADVHSAYTIIAKAYRRASELLRRGRIEAVQAQIHLDRLQKDIFPLFDALGQEMDDRAWANEGAEALVALALALQAASSHRDEYVSSLS